MSETYLSMKAKVLLEEFECAFSNAWDAAQCIQDYIHDVYDGDRSEFMNNALRDCDYCAIAKALQMLFGFSEN